MVLLLNCDIWYVEESLSAQAVVLVGDTNSQLNLTDGSIVCAGYVWPDARLVQLHYCRVIFLFMLPTTV
eukprot:5344761-Amphidinium_carterae.1